MSNKPLTDSILLVVLGIIIAVLFSERACNSGEPQKNDTTYIKGNPDTIIVHDTISNTIYKPEPYAVYPSPVDSSIGINDLDSIRIYLTSIYDSAADVVVRDSVRGFLLHKDTQVRIKNRTITQIDTLKINIPTPFNNKSLKLGLGMATLLFRMRALSVLEDPCTSTFRNLYRPPSICRGNTRTDIFFPWLGTGT